MRPSFLDRLLNRTTASSPVPQNATVQSGGTKAESIRQLVNLGTVGDVKDAYLENVWSYAGVKAISTNISGVPFLLRTYSKKGEVGKDVNDPSNPFVALFDNPNPLFDPLQLWKITATFYETRGEAFWILYNKFWNPISPGEVPVYIEVADPAALTARFNKNNLMVGWTYRRKSSNEASVALDVDFNNCLRFFEFNPVGILKSLSPLDVAKTSIGIDQKIHLYNDKFFKNGGQVMGYLLDENKDSELGETDINRMRALWQKQYAGLNNAHQTPFLTNGVKFVATGTNQKDMDFYNLTKIIREEIVGALNVPKSQVGLYEDLNFATAKVADRQFFTNNLIPKMNYFASVLNSKLLHRHGLECYFDTTVIEALKEDREKKVKVAKGLWELGYPLNEINQMQDLGMNEVVEEWANKAEDMRESPEDAKEPAEDEEGDGLGGRKNGAESDSSPDRSADQEAGNSAIADLFFSADKDSGSESLKAYQKAVINPFAFLAQPKLVTFFSKLRNAQLKAIDDAGTLTIAEVDNITFNLDKWSDKYMSTIFQFQYDSAMAAAHYTLAEAKCEGVDTEAIPELSETNLQMMADTLTDMYDEGVYTIAGLHRRIRAVILDGARNNTPLDDVKSAVRNVVKLALSSINVLVYTEISGAANMVRWKVMSKIPNAKKRWVSSKDTKVRDRHGSYDDLKPQSMNFEYTVGLKYPGDRHAVPSDFVNCRCFTQLVIEK